jgi:hypothetical protein
MTSGPGARAANGVAFLGALCGAALSVALASHLPGLAGYSELLSHAPASARYVAWATALPFPALGALISLAAIRLLSIHGVWTIGIPSDVALTPFPFDPSHVQLVLGEEHNADGTRSSSPRWRILPEKGMCTGILVTGATGSAKTSAAQYPFTAQLVRLHAHDSDRKLGGLVIDAKGNYADFVREQCAQAGRADDYYEISLDSGVRYNVIGRPDLEAPALGGHIADMIVNVQGKSTQDPFWHQEAKDLATQVIRIVRLAQGREPTMVDLYRLSTSVALFQDWLCLAEARVRAGHGDLAEYNALEFWQKQKNAGLDPKLKGSIAATLNGVCSLFDVPRIRDVFAPTCAASNFPGFDDLIAGGKIVALRVPYSQLKTVSQIVGTMTKLNFFDAVLGRLANADAGRRSNPGRLVFFVADEYDGYVTQPADGNFLSKCREARCCTLVATQSYESFTARLHDEHVTHQLLANLRTKIWLCCEDNYTARQAADLCGEIEREKVSRSRNENSQGSFSVFDGRFVSSDGGSFGESTSVNLQREHLFSPRAFTRLKLNQAIVKMFDGERVWEPAVIYLKAAYLDPERSWFEDEDETGVHVGDTIGRP